jgi:murein DD-endopeptidase MepM/ murein hydrolase activator NlpD
MNTIARLLIAMPVSGALSLGALYGLDEAGLTPSIPADTGIEDGGTVPPPEEGGSETSDGEAEDTGGADGEGDSGTGEDEGGSGGETGSEDGGDGAAVVTPAGPLDFDHMPPGQLPETTIEFEDGSASVVGSTAHLAEAGYTNPEVFAPDMRFPLRAGPAYANSQIMLPTRGALFYPGRYRDEDNNIVDVWLDGVRYARPWGDQFAPQNFAYPWFDNFCEVRYSGNARCGSGRGHQGQDIRPGSCTHNHIVVAAADGELETLSGLSVDLYADDEAGTVYRYLHLDRPLLVDLEPGETIEVTKGQPIGFLSNISNREGARLTTVHLHFEIWAGSPGGSGPLPPYTSLVEAYRRLGGEDPANHDPLEEIGNCSYPNGGIGPTRAEVLALLEAESDPLDE